MRTNTSIGRMRVQLQQSHSGKTLNTYGITVDAESDTGVTVLQVRNLLQRLYDTVQEKAPWFQFNNYESELVQAIVLLSERVGRYSPWGVEGDHQNIEREEWEAVRGRTYRIDLENMRGINLQVVVDESTET